ncbi:MAG: PD-(D/E)XK nuclease family protein [Minisyncoccia bacterium]
MKKREKNIYNSSAKEPFSLSRSKIDLFIECPRCFYLDVKLGISRPPGLPFSLNQAVDTLLKKEFDIHRAKNEKYPLLERYGIKLRPLNDKRINEWRKNLVGIRYYHEPTNLEIYGAIDDVWVDEKGEIYIVDFKSTSSGNEITLDDEWKDSYKRQMEIYQWLFRKNGFKVSKTGFFVYCNGKTDREAFDGKLEFDISVLPYEGDDSWIEQELFNIKKTLDSDTMPPPSANCDYCSYYLLRRKEEL